MLPSAARPARDVLSLDGEWALAFDPENRGRAAGWAEHFPRDFVAAAVPSVWERVRPGYDGTGWYRRTFELPAGWGKRTLRLRFHAAQYFAEVWLNGVLLGAHEGGFLPFEFTVTDHARPGENVLVVRVINPPLDGVIEGFRCGGPLNQGPIPVGKAGWYYNFGGLWQSVELQATDGVALTRVCPQPRLADDEVEVQIVVECDGAPAAHEISCEVTDMDGQVVVPAQGLRRRLKTGVNRVSLRVAMPGARRWSPEDPYLHTARVTVWREGAARDSTAVRFGMREFTARGGRFLLNGRPVMLKGFLHQGSYPRTLVVPEDREFAERELRAVKDRGFNFVRAHMLPPEPAWLDLCDELGVLVMAEPPIGWIERTSLAEKRCWREIAGLVERDAHHASIVVWCLMNEVFHLRGFTPDVVIGMTARWLRRVRRMDPTRMVIDVSGGHGFLPAGGAEDMLPDTAGQGLTAMLALPGPGPLQSMLDAHVYHEFPQSDATIRRLRTAGQGDLLFFLSEYGAPPVPPMFDEVLAKYSAAERKLGLEDYRLHADFAESLRRCFAHPAVRAACGDERGFLRECNRLRAEEMHLSTLAFRSNPRVAGFCFCQLADASGELFGALDIWRRPKPVMETLAEASADGAVGIFVTPRVATAGAPLEVELVWPGGDPAGRRSVSGRWTLELTGPDGTVKKRWSKSFRLTGPRTPRRLLKIKAPAPAQPGLWRWSVSGRVDQAPLQGRLETRVIARAPVARGAVAVNGVQSALGAELAKLGLDVLPFGNNFREAHAPVIYDMSKPVANRQLWFEELGQLRKVLQLGGCAIALDPEMALVREVIPEAAVHMQPMMRPVAYTVSSPVFGGLPCGGLSDFSWAELGATRHDRADDVLQLGGAVLAGALSFNMWTRPAEFQHGASLYTLPVGKGTLIVCHHPVLAVLAAGHAAARPLLGGLADFARARICITNTDGFLSRCIDPLPVVEDAPRPKPLS